MLIVLTILVYYTIFSDGILVSSISMLYTVLYYISCIVIIIV